MNWVLFRKYRKPLLIQGIEPENAVSFANGKFSEFQKQKIRKTPHTGIDNNCSVGN